MWATENAAFTSCTPIPPHLFRAVILLLCWGWSCGTYNHPTNNRGRNRTEGTRTNVKTWGWLFFFVCIFCVESHILLSISNRFGQRMPSARCCAENEGGKNRRPPRSLFFAPVGYPQLSAPPLVVTCCDPPPIRSAALSARRFINPTSTSDNLWPPLRPPPRPSR